MSSTEATLKLANVTDTPKTIRTTTELFLKFFKVLELLLQVRRDYNFACGSVRV
jgi:hypothetical protein